MDNQLRLFDDEKKKRAPPRVMLHVIDAGQGECDGGSHMVRMACSKCGHETEWFEVKSTTEGRKGVPCPTCNVDQTHSDEA